MKDTTRKIKMFFASFLGRALLTVILYFVIMGLTLLILTVFDAPIVAVILAVIFTVFGWKALSRITPNVFLTMPIGGWITYCMVKGTISFFLGVFVAPFVIGKRISAQISAELSEQLEREPSPQITITQNNSKQVVKNKTTIQVNQEFQHMLMSIQTMSEQKLREMHKILLPYCLEAPVPVDNRDYRKDLQEFSQRKLEKGSLFGCQTYGEVEKLNEAIVHLLSQFEENA